MLPAQRQARTDHMNERDFVRERVIRARSRSMIEVARLSKKEGEVEGEVDVMEEWEWERRGWRAEGGW